MVAGDQGKKEETWRDWCAPDGFGAPGRPDPELLTRAELLATLEGWGEKDVKESALRYWATVGVIPQPERRGTVGKQQALYPWWVADLIAQLHQHRARGLTLEQLPNRMRFAARYLSRIPAANWIPERPLLADEKPFVPTLLPREFSPQVMPPIARMMAKHQAQLGVTFERAELHLITTAGESIIYKVPVKQHQEPPDERGVQ